MFDFSNYSTNQNTMIIQRNYERKMKDEIGEIATEEFIGLKPKMC